MRHRNQRAKVDLDERFSLHPMDPEEALRKLLQGTKKQVAQGKDSDQADDPEGSKREP
jgi:hypothetical protein